MAGGELIVTDDKARTDFLKVTPGASGELKKVIDDKARQHFLKLSGRSRIGANRIGSSANARVDHGGSRHVEIGSTLLTLAKMKTMHARALRI